MKYKNYLIIALMFLFGATTVMAQSDIKIKTGIEVLKEQNFKLLEGKRVALITNPTGVDNNMKSTADILFEAPNVELVALFAPEHGVRGNAHAGDEVANEKDIKTGLPVHSLHGKTRVPTKEMLDGIDVLVYDIQDIGCRSFTYISTMGLAMEVAGKLNKEFVVLDRPNPLGGNKVEGGLVDDNCISFVSQFKIPYLYGLTCGELAMMLNEENMLESKCKLTVVSMKKWKRKMTYEQTGLQWIASSPHIPQAVTSAFYPISGILGELGYISIGVGYTIPFQLFGSDWLDAEALAEKLNGLNLAGLHFRPIYFKPYYAVGQGKEYQGVQVHLMDYEKANLSEIQFYVMQEIANLYPDRAVFDHADEKRYRMFDQVTGSKFVRETFTKNNTFESIKGFWNDKVEPFKKLSKKYYLYK